MDDYKVDYHIHTTASDGAMRPTEIVKQAKELEYDIIAITDHDNVDGVSEALIAGEAVGLKVVPGVEIAVETEREVGLHIIGYNIDIENQALKDFLANLIRRREQRNRELLGALQEMGYHITEDDIEMGKNSFMGKPAIVSALLKKGYIVDERQGYGPKGLNSPQCRKVKRGKPLASEAIDVIRKAGGTAVLAHPIQVRGIGPTGSDLFFDNIERIIRKLKTQGLKGLECFHPDQNEAQSMRFVEIAGKYHLHITRGSDFHGSDFSKAEKTANYR